MQREEHKLQETTQFKAIFIKSSTRVKLHSTVLGVQMHMIELLQKSKSDKRAFLVHWGR